jgi:hypothetical protein
MAWAPIALAVGANAIQGVAAIQQGQAQASLAKAQGQAQADADARDAQMTKIAAEQSQASRLEDLQRTVGTIRAGISSRGLDPSSPSAMALEGAADKYAKRNIAREAFNASQQIANDNLDARTAQTVAGFKASAARQAGYMSAASSLFKAGSLSNSYFDK